MPSNFVETIVSQTMSLDLTAAGIKSRRSLSELCTDIFLIVIRMREAEDLGEPAPLKKLISYYMDLFEKNCRAMKIPDDDRVDALYALVALMDETVLSIPGACSDYWVSQPMQLQRFETNLAGEEFYERLKKILLQPDKRKQVLEVYFLCLSLGFEGKYKIMNREERNGIIDETGRALRRVRSLKSSPLSPHGLPNYTARLKKPLRKGVPLWLIGAVSAVGTVLLWIILFSMNSSHTSSVVDILSGIR